MHTAMGTANPPSGMPSPALTLQRKYIRRYLTVGCRRNIKPEWLSQRQAPADCCGNAGARLNDSTVNSSAPRMNVAEKKYKDPFSFKPCHTLVLYTNHLPRVSASDDGIWRRLIVIPFNAKIEGKADIKNYGEYLYENAGESILAWIIEGAKKVIALDYQIPVPDCVTKAIDEYRSQNDWFGHFLDEKCDVDESFKETPRRSIRHTATTRWTAMSMCAARQIFTLRWRKPDSSD